jgi:hypothetical protein
MNDDIRDLYSDMAACLMAIKNLLASKGVASHEEFVHAFQERLLTLQAAKQQKPYLLLNGVARGEMKDDSDL